MSAIAHFNTAEEHWGRRYLNSSQIHTDDRTTSITSNQTGGGGA